jgi:hopanoid biosynthesis associated protein HpnK
LKLLIVNGDDFGACAEANAGILRCHREGILTSTSLMVSAPARDAAVAQAQECPELDVGLHLVVCQGRSVLDPRLLAALVDTQGDFANSPVLAGARYFFNRGLRQKLVDECRAQIETHLQLVGYLKHINGHLNFHVHPVIIDILVELAAEYDVPFVRLPRERVLTTMRLSRDHGARKLVEAAIFRILSARARRRMAERGIRSTDWLFGLHQSGNITERYLRGLLARLPDGCVTELYFHPAADIGERPPDAAAQHEVDLLTNPELHDLLARHDICLTTYAKLASDGGSPLSTPSQRARRAG